MDCACSPDADSIPQFNVSNTIPDTVLEEVSIIMQPGEDSGLTEKFIIPLPSLSSATSPGIIYVSFARDTPDAYATSSFQCGMRFVSKELDPSTGEPEQDGYEDEYQLEEVELSASDYIVPSYTSFAAEWDRLRSGATATETFALSAMESLKGRGLLLSTVGPRLIEHFQLRVTPSSRSLTWSRSAVRRLHHQPPCMPSSCPGSSPAVRARY